MLVAWGAGVACGVIIGDGDERGAWVITGDGVGEGECNWLSVCKNSLLKLGFNIARIETAIIRINILPMSYWM